MGSNIILPGETDITRIQWQRVGEGEAIFGSLARVRSEESTTAPPRGENKPEGATRRVEALQRVHQGAHREASRDIGRMCRHKWTQDEVRALSRAPEMDYYHLWGLLRGEWRCKQQAHCPQVLHHVGLRCGIRAVHKKSHKGLTVAVEQEEKGQGVSRPQPLTPNFFD